MVTSGHSTALRRLSALVERDPRFLHTTAPKESRPLHSRATGLDLYLEQADLSWSSVAPFVFLGGIIPLVAFSFSFLWGSSIAALVIWLGAAYLDARRYERSQRFNRDFPQVALAVASGLRVGLSPLVALERSVRALPADSLARSEVERLNEALHRGTPPDEALRAFGHSIALPELELFRRGFTLVLKHGGRFSPTLERLAQVGRDRATLIQSARTSTTTMRMTANVLICVAPLVVLLLSFRRSDFWHVLFTHPVASQVGALGTALLVGSYLTLRLMSRFRP